MKAAGSAECLRPEGTIRSRRRKHVCKRGRGTVDDAQNALPKVVVVRWMVKMAKVERYEMSALLLWNIHDSQGLPGALLHRVVSRESRSRGAVLQYAVPDWDPVGEINRQFRGQASCLVFPSPDSGVIQLSLKRSFRMRVKKRVAT